MKTCFWCRSELEATIRSDAKFCSQRCRQASHRFGQGIVARARAERPMRFAYADPPYPGKSSYYAGRDDYGGEVDHAELLSRLDPYDGWALSTSAAALPQIICLAIRAGMVVMVAAWVKGVRSGPARHPLSSWEPVVFAGGRRFVRNDQPADSLIYNARPRMTDPGRVIGMKPAAFCYWMFDLLGALPGDSFDDLFPGSGGVSRAWERYVAVAGQQHVNVSPSSAPQVAQGNPSILENLSRGVFCRIGETKSDPRFPRTHDLDEGLDSGMGVFRG